MEHPTIEKKLNTYLSWEEGVMETQRDNFLYTALEKLQAEHEKTDTALRPNKSIVKEKTPDNTVKEWQQLINQDTIKSLGTEFTFTKNSHNVETTFLNRNPLKHIQKEETIASLSYHGAMDTLSLYELPKEQLLINKSETADYLKFLSITNIMLKDRFKRDELDAY